MFAKTVDKPVDRHVAALVDAINNAAYWDYQRERVYVKSNVNLKHALTRPRRRKKVLSPNETIECPRPRKCPKCASRKSRSPT